MTTVDKTLLIHVQSDFCQVLKNNITEINLHMGTDGRLFVTDVCATSKSRDTKTRPNIKNSARANLDIVP